MEQFLENMFFGAAITRFGKVNNNQGKVSVNHHLYIIQRGDFNGKYRKLLGLLPALTVTQDIHQYKSYEKLYLCLIQKHVILPTLVKVAQK